MKNIFINILLILLLSTITLSLAKSTLAHEVSGANVIHMKNQGFEPKTITIHQGEKVIFENVDTVDHWPASNIHPDHSAYPGSGIEKCNTDQQKNIFDACRGYKPGESYSFVFKNIGDWNFHDHLNATLSGKITVIQDDGKEKVEPKNLESSKQATSLASSLTRALTSAKNKIDTFYFSLFPKKLDEYFKKNDMFEIVKDKQKLTHTLIIAGSKRSMAELLKDSESGKEQRDCHQAAHIMGRVAFEIYGAKVFQEGNANCHSGFYHGAMEAFLAKEGTENLSKNIEKLCSVFDTKFGKFECLHGVGHGIMAYENYDLPQALKTCKTLGGSARACYGGVFMENVMASSGIGALAGHETSWVSDDPLFPCNTLNPDSQEEIECYKMQTSRMLVLKGKLDFNYVKDECLHAPEQLIPVCYTSMGRDIAGNMSLNPKKIKQACSIVSKENGYQDACIKGALNVIVDFWGPELKNQANDLCSILDTSSKKNCQNLLAERMKDFKL